MPSRLSLSIIEVALDSGRCIEGEAFLEADRSTYGEAALEIGRCMCDESALEFDLLEALGGRGDDARAMGAGIVGDGARLGVGAGDGDAFCGLFIDA